MTFGCCPKPPSPTQAAKCEKVKKGDGEDGNCLDVHWLYDGEDGQGGNKQLRMMDMFHQAEQFSSSVQYHLPADVPKVHNVPTLKQMSALIDPVLPAVRTVRIQPIPNRELTETVQKLSLTSSGAAPQLPVRI